MKRLISAGLGVFMALVAVTASSALLTFSFTGSVTDDPFGLSSFGAPISGAYSFDSAATDAIPAADSGSYTSNGSGFGFDTTVDGTPYAVTGSLNISVVNAGTDQYLVTADDGMLRLELFFEGASGSAFGTDALPLAPPLLAAFPFRQFRLFGTDVEFLGAIDSVVCAAGCNGGNDGGGSVPEPGTLLLLCAALAGFTIRRRG